ncbi:MAG TPA: nucleoside hydrolase [Chitinophagaceae bacterium]|nr:nucleoside hydrolase [Chitinophagaceae bacterium]
MSGKQVVTYLLLAVCLPTSCYRPIAKSKERAVNIIFDTDIGPDVDDVGAVAVLHALADKGEATILGMLCNTTSEWGAPCLNALNTYYGRADIPIGTLKSTGTSGDSPDWNGFAYNRFIAEEFPNNLKSGLNAPDAIDVYRRILAKQQDNTVVIISVGALTNLRNLLLSKADQFSQLSGAELVQKKVKILSLMAGGYPKGKENDPNFMMDIDASIYVVNNWPGFIMFSGVEIGQPVKTGAKLIETPPGNPVREAYIQWDSHFWKKWDSNYVERSIHPHDSYDQTSVLFAIRGLHDYWLAEYDGKNTVFENGSNEWKKVVGGRHHYLVQKRSPESIAQVIDSLMNKPRKYKRHIY